MARTHLKNKTLSEALNDYERHLRARGLADNSVKNNVQAIRRALDVWGDIQVRSITSGHIDQLFGHYGWKESTRNLYLGYLRSFFAWARRSRHMPREYDPTDGWRSIKVPRTDRLRIPVEEFGSIIEAAPHPRDRALCAIGLYTFLRGSEIQSLRVGDLDLDDFTLRVYRRKTKEEDVLPVSSELAVEMVRWLNWYQQDQGPLMPDWYLTPAKLPAKTGYNPDTRQIFVDPHDLASLKPDRPIHRPYLAVQRSLSALGYDTHWQGEHTLRRSGARAMADSLREMGHDSALLRVASMLGHKDVRVTQEYIGWELEKEARNLAIAGKPMFPRATTSPVATVTELKREA